MSNFLMAWSKSPKIVRLNNVFYIKWQNNLLYLSKSSCYKALHNIHMIHIWMNLIQWYTTCKIDKTDTNRETQFQIFRLERNDSRTHNNRVFAQIMTMLSNGYNENSNYYSIVVWFLCFASTMK